MGMSFLEFRGAKQFFRRTAFFVVLGSLWKWFLRGFTGCRAQLPLPASLFRRQRLGDEKKVLRRTALPENSNGHQVSLLAAPAFIEQRFGCEA
ncbi:hypothetical protein DTW91_03450 [Chryseobacterium sp. SC28]|nr:hypothetical protein DTW91_03450 [Chryseobacterium sp. SC28]